MSNNNQVSVVGLFLNIETIHFFVIIILKTLKVKTSLLCDFWSVLPIAKNHAFYYKTKYISICYHFV